MSIVGVGGTEEPDRRACGWAGPLAWLVSVVWTVFPEGTPEPARALLLSAFRGSFVLLSIGLNSAAETTSNTAMPPAIGTAKLRLFGAGAARGEAAGGGGTGTVGKLRGVRVADRATRVAGTAVRAAVG